MCWPWVIPPQVVLPHRSLFAAGTDLPTQRGAACPCPGQRGGSMGLQGHSSSLLQVQLSMQPPGCSFFWGLSAGWAFLAMQCWGQPRDPSQPPAVPLLRATCSLLFAAASLQQGCARLQPPTACSPPNKGGSEPPLPLGTLQQSPSLRQQKPFPIPEPAAAPFPSPAPSSPLPQPALLRGLQPALPPACPRPDFLGIWRT